GGEPPLLAVDIGFHGFLHPSSVTSAHARVIDAVRRRLYITTLRNSPATQSQSRSVPSSAKPSFVASRRDDRFSGSIRASIRCTWRCRKQCEITGGAASVMKPWRQHDGTTIHPSASRRCCSLWA